MKNKPHPKITARLAILTAAFAIGSVHAVTLSWVGSTGTTTTASTGTWDLNTSQTWNDGTGTGPDAKWTAANAAVFGGSTGVAVTVSGSFSAQRMLFSTTGYTLSAATATQTISLTDNTGGTTPQLEVSTGVTATIGANVKVVPVSTGLIIGEHGSTAGGTLNISGTVDQVSANTGGVDGFGTIVNINTGGTLAMSSGGGTSGGFVIGQNTGSDVTVNVEGGTLSHSGSASALSVGAGGNGTLNVDSGTVTFTTNVTKGGLVLGNGTGSGTVNLNGGSIVPGAITKGASGTGTFNFNGGLLQSNVANASFMTGLTAANVRNGGALISSAGGNITIGQALLHSSIGGDNAIDGGLTKSGANTLTLSGANTYTGATKVTAGTLALGNVLAIQNSALDVTGAGAVTFTASGSTFTVGGLQNNAGTGSSGTTVALGAKSLTLNSSGVSSLTIASAANFQTLASAGFKVTTTAAFTLDGTFNISFSSALPAGSYTFNTISGITAGAFATINILGSYSAAGLNSVNSWTQSDGAGNIFSFNNTTGVLSVTAVPEPVHFSLAIVACLVVLVCRRTKVRRQALK